MALLVKKGSYVGSGSDGGSLNVGGVGFQPKFVWIFSASNSATYDAHRNPYFHSDVALASVGGGTFRMGETNAGWINSRDNITSVTTDGFTESYTATAAYKYLHFGSQTYPWICLGGSDCASGSFVGNAADNRDITGIGFQPVFVMIWGATTGNVGPIMRIAPQTGDNSYAMNTGGQIANQIQAMLPDGFQVGSSAAVNPGGNTVFYIAIKDSPNVITGTYNGDNTDNRDISLSSPTFKPAFIILKSRSGTIAVGGETVTPGDAAKTYTSLGYLGDYIQASVAGSFQVGLSMNATGQVYDYIAFSERVGPETMARMDGSISAEIATIDFVQLKDIDNINSVT